jgi:hypothetical protein
MSSLFCFYSALLVVSAKLQEQATDNKKGYSIRVAFLIIGRLVSPA